MSGQVLTLPDPGAALPSTQPIDIGTGEAEAQVGGLLYMSTTPIGTPANLNENELLEYLLPANALAVNGRGLRIWCMWQTAVSGGTKAVLLYFGATPIMSFGNSGSGHVGQCIAHVVRTGASAQLSWSFVTSANGLGTATRQTPSSLLNAPVSIRFTATTGLAVANELVLHAMQIEAL